MTKTSANSKATIGFVLFPERGGYYPTYQLANALKQNGYNVVYFGTNEFKEDVQAQGFIFESTLDNELEDVCFDPLPPTQSLTFLERYKRDAIARHNKTEAMLTNICTGSFFAAFDKYNIRILLVDALLPYVALASHCKDYKVITVATELVGNDQSLPPHTLPVTFREDSIVDKFKVKLSWLHFNWQNKGRIAFQRILALRYPILVVNPSLIKRFAKIVCNNRLDSITCEYGMRPKLPELVMCPSEFNFKLDKNRQGRYFCGHSIDTQRKEIDFSWDELDDDLPIIYCSLGTHVAEYKYSDRFFKHLLKLAQSKPKLQFIVSMGPGRELSGYGYVPENVIAQKRVPQISVLQRAALMLTNAGLGTVKKCIYFGVPMLALPCDFDQPGNGARIEFKNIGLVQNIKSVSVKKLGLKIDKLLYDPIYKNSIGAMSERVRNSGEFSTALQFLETQFEQDNRRNTL
jgi:zeaxanthin glucosyltransferase